MPHKTRWCFLPDDRSEEERVQEFLGFPSNEDIVRETIDSFSKDLSGILHKGSPKKVETKPRTAVAA